MEYQNIRRYSHTILLRGLSKNNHYHNLADIINGWRVHDDNIPVIILCIQKYFRSMSSQNGYSHGNHNSSSYSGRQNNIRQYLGNINAHPYHTSNTTVLSRRREPMRHHKPYRNISHARQERNQRLPERHRRPSSNPHVIVLDILLHSSPKMRVRSFIGRECKLEEVIGRYVNR